ncbi:MAG: nuclear transport factor 2 family protein [Acidobacteriota bacterium]|nr:nuclear transport factor 2 family protein [Acidobacteriota bacterium]
MLKRLLTIIALTFALAAYGLAQNSNSSTRTRTRTTTPKTTTNKTETGGTETGAQTSEQTPAARKPTQGRRTGGNEPTAKDVLAAFNALLDAVRRADAEAVAAFYWNSPQLEIYNSNGSVTKGWAQMHSNIVSSYPNLKDVKLDARDVHVQMLGRDGATVSFLWTQSQTVGGTPETGTGRTTLVYRRIGTSWKIVHRHTSPESPDASRILPSERTTPTPTPSPTPKVRP